MPRSHGNPGFSDATNWRGFAPAAPDFSTTGPHGHRARMRDRLLDRGAAALADYEILEMLLFLGIPRIDTKPLAKAAINRFGSLAAVLSAPASALLRMEGLTSSSLTAFHLVREATQRLAQAETSIAPTLSDWDAVRAHLKRAATLPHMLVFHQDGRNRVLAEDRYDTAPEISAILRRALDLHASAILAVTAREHPNPVQADYAMLDKLQKAGETVSVTIHDHFLWDGEELFSLTRKRFVL